MPRAMVNLRQTVRRAGRSLSFSRPAPGCDRPVPTKPANTSSPARSRSLLPASRSFPNLARLVERRGPVFNDPLQEELTCPNLTLHKNNFTSQDAIMEPEPLSHSNTSTITADGDGGGYIGGAPGVSATPSVQETTLPAPKPFLRRISSSQRLRRLSLGGLRDRDRMTRTTSTMSYGDSPSRVWSSTGSSAALSPRSTTDDALWMRLRPARADRIRRKRHGSYACSDFEVSEPDPLVEIGKRLPDRANAVAEEDVFGRRRGDFARDIEMMLDTTRESALACEVDGVSKDDETLRDMKGYLTGAGEKGTAGSERSGNDDEDEEATIRHITKAIDSSKGRLRKSANMSRAFKAVIKSGEGLVRKSELIKATLNSEDSKDPSMIILLDPDSCDPANPQLEGASNTSDEGGSVDTTSSGNTGPCIALGFSTSMTAKQCAATLETLLREMACKVSRYPDTEEELKNVVRLRAMRVPHGGRRMDRKIKIMVTIREEDHIRTSVSFKRLAGLYSSRDSHIPLCTEIRDRFQREWPAVVEALYIRLPNSSLMQKQKMSRPEPLTSEAHSAM